MGSEWIDHTNRKVNYLYHGISRSGAGESKGKNEDAKPSGNEKKKKKSIAGFFTIVSYMMCQYITS